MTLFETFPDAEAICGHVLRSGGVTGGRVYSSIPGTPVWPLTTVKRLGGLPVEAHALDGARIQVEVWGTKKSEARAGAELARRLLHLAEGTTFAQFAGYITGVRDDLGLTFLPDPETARDRYVFAVRVFTRGYVT